VSTDSEQFATVIFKKTRLANLCDLPVRSSTIMHEAEAKKASAS
jgi:hypothetical protein